METANQSGVYCIEIVEKDKFYIGSSKNLRIRKNLHYSHIKNKNYDHGNRILIDEFHFGTILRFSILEITDNYLNREQFWIDDFKSKNKQIINIFDADRLNSNVPDSFKNKMSQVAKNRWKDPAYRAIKLEQNKATQFTPERLNKEVLVFKNNILIAIYASAKIAAKQMSLNNISLSSAARGKFRDSHIYKGYKFIYKEVLYKQGELLEHPEVDNQQPNLSRNALKGSTTNSRSLTNDVEGSNGNTSALHVEKYDDIV